MGKKNKILIYPLIVMGVVLVLANSCTKDDVTSMTKKDPIINWANPDAINVGTLLSEIQLNATSDVAGTFVYTPATGTKLNAGANQDLKVDFKPFDAVNYNAVSRTVRINVLQITSIGGVSTAVFHPNRTYGTMTDIDGNVYKTITIGTQTWMAENLSTTHYSNGDPIPDVTNNKEWESLSSSGYCWYNNDEATYKGTYGALYNWYAVKTDKLCPTGWHVPSNDEWNTLITYLGGEIAAGVKVIETGNTHWLRTIVGATNETGFTGLPGGFRSISNDFRGFVSLGYFGLWWTTTDYTPPYDALVTQLPSYDYSDEGHWGFEAGFAAKKIGGVSVRCVKN
jgi:uncharacterized protein (TIGR02145 family)